MAAKILSRYYYSPSSPAYLSNASQLLKIVKKKHPHISRRQVDEYLEEQKTHQLHKKFRKSKKWKQRVSKCVPLGLHTMHHADLADLHNFAKENSGAKWLLVCTDVLSRMSDATPLKSKSAADTLAAFKRIYLRHKILPPPWTIYTEYATSFEFCFEYCLCLFSFSAEERNLQIRKCNNFSRPILLTTTSPHRTAKPALRKDLFGF